MVEFLIKRPIGVIMVVFALITLGIINGYKLPVSLLPDISIPRITIQIDYPGTSSRYIESSVTRPIRESLLQLNKLESLESRTMDEHSFIELKFDLDTKFDYSFIEVNEKIDAMMGFMPREMPRPKVIKSSVSNIPVFYLDIIPDSSVFSYETGFLEFSEIVETIIKRRIEQLPEVAFSDISGSERPQVTIIPDKDKMKSLNINSEDIERVLNNKNIQVGNLLVRNGQYEYHIRFETPLHSVNNIGEIFLKTSSGKIITINEIADVQLHPRQQKGLYLSGHKRGIVLAIIKQEDAQMASLKRSINKLLFELEDKYPSYSFEISQDQTALLDYSITNLKQSLMLAILFSMMVTILFLSNIRSSLVIGISIPIVMLISLFFFFVFDISINIISLSGLILGVGMMVDNSIIVVDNISQHLEQSKQKIIGFTRGTNEIIRPLISAALTTCSVFIPLIFLSGLTGALFYEQAISVSITLFVSLFISIMFIPVLFNVLNNSKKVRQSSDRQFFKVFEKYYHQGLEKVLGRPVLYILLFLLLIPLGIILFTIIEKRNFPDLKYQEVFLNIDWNENISTSVNHTRADKIIALAYPYCISTNSFVGRQDFILQNYNNNSQFHACLYFDTKSVKCLNELKSGIRNHIRSEYPMASYSFSSPENIFEKVFAPERHPIIIAVRPISNKETLSVERIKDLISDLKELNPGIDINPVLTNKTYYLSIDLEKLVLYDIPYHKVMKVLSMACNKNNIGFINNGNTNIPLTIGFGISSLFNLIYELQVRNNNGNMIPLSSLIKVSLHESLKTIICDQHGELFPIFINKHPDPTFQTDNIILPKTERDLQFTISGYLLKNKKMIREVGIILMISVLLLFFILTAQFESLILPLIILFEIILDISGSLLFLILCGSTFNIMAGIGIIVMSGIIINDSILKIDVINNLRLSGKSLKYSILEGGRRRLKSILMTSITTIFALVPILYFGGLGLELQKPLAIAIIGGLSVGTIVSLFFIPVAYQVLFRDK